MHRIQVFSIARLNMKEDKRTRMQFCLLFSQFTKQTYQAERSFSITITFSATRQNMPCALRTQRRRQPSKQLWLREVRISQLPKNPPGSQPRNRSPTLAAPGLDRH